MIKIHSEIYQNYYLIFDIFYYFLLQYQSFLYLADPPKILLILTDSINFAEILEIISNYFIKYTIKNLILYLILLVQIIVAVLLFQKELIYKSFLFTSYIKLFFLIGHLILSKFCLFHLLLLNRNTISNLNLKNIFIYDLNRCRDILLKQSFVLF